MTYLLDVNVLLALLDPAHTFHDPAHEWFAATGEHGWATCPITENAVIRIASLPAYPNSPGPPSVVGGIFSTFLEHPGHTFWPDDFSILDGKSITVDRLASAEQITDSYLLALAVRHGGALATFDRKLSPAPVIGGAAALELIQ